MNWTELGQEIAKIGLPLLGAALPIPGGIAIGTALASAISSPSTKPEDILSALTANADTMQKAKEFELQHQERLIQMAYDNEVAMRKADSSDIQQVNTTMQAEIVNSATESWYQKAWRPFNGFTFGIVLALNYGLTTIVNTFAPMFDTTWHAIVSQPIPESVFVAWGSVLGVTAWHRGKMQVAKVMNG